MGLLDYFPSLQLPGDCAGSAVEAGWNTPISDIHQASLPLNSKDAYLVDDAPMPEHEMLPYCHHRQNSTDAPMSDEELRHLRFKHSQGYRPKLEWGLEMIGISFVIVLLCVLPRPKDVVVLRSLYVVLSYSLLGCYYTLFLHRRFSSGESGTQNMLNFMAGMRTSRFLTALARLPLFFAVSSIVGCVVHIVIRLYAPTVVLKD